jgi:hypothetical protein
LWVVRCGLTALKSTCIVCSGMVLVVHKVWAVVPLLSQATNGLLVCTLIAFEGMLPWGGSSALHTVTHGSLLILLHCWSPHTYGYPGLHAMGVTAQAGCAACQRACAAHNHQPCSITISQLVAMDGNAVVAANLHLADLATKQVGSEPVSALHYILCDHGSTSTAKELPAHSVGRPRGPLLTAGRLLQLAGPA